MKCLIVQLSTRITWASGLRLSYTIHFRLHPILYALRELVRKEVGACSTETWPIWERY